MRFASNFSDTVTLAISQLSERQPEAAIATFDACLAARGRDFHSLAYKAHALDDTGEHSAARRLVNDDDYVRSYSFATSDSYSDMAAFNAALASCGVVLFDKGHERPHLHPNGC